MNKKSNSRIFWCDYLRGICMLGVLAIHLGVPEIIYRSFSPIFLTGFFFTSGYLDGTKDKNTFWLHKRISSLIIPFLSFGIINLLVNIIFNHSDLQTIRMDFFKFLLQVSGSKGDILWFLSCLITCEIINWLVTSICEDHKKMKIAFYLGLCGVGFILSYNKVHLPWHVEVAFVVIMFMFAGELYRIYENRLNAFIKSIYSMPLLCLGIYIILYILYPYEYIDLHLGIYSNIPVFLVSAICGIFFLICLCKKINHPICLKFIGQNTLIYYAFQVKCFFVLKKIFLIQNYIISWFSIYIFSVLLLGIGSIFINHHFPILLGRKQKK